MTVRSMKHRLYVSSRVRTNRRPKSMSYILDVDYTSSLIRAVSFSIFSGPASFLHLAFV